MYAISSFTRVVKTLLGLLLCCSGEVVIKDDLEYHTRWAHNVCASETEEGYVTMWQGTKDGEKEIAAQRYDANGYPEGEKIRIADDSEILIDRKCSISYSNNRDIIASYIQSEGIQVVVISGNESAATNITVDGSVYKHSVTRLTSNPSDSSAFSVIVGSTAGMFMFRIETLNGTVITSSMSVITTGVKLSSTLYIEPLEKQLVCVTENNIMKLLLVANDGTSSYLHFDHNVKKVSLSAIAKTHHQSIVAVYWTGDAGTFVQLFSVSNVTASVDNAMMISKEELSDIHIASIPTVFNGLVLTETEQSTELTGRLLRVSDNQNDYQLVSEYQFLIKDHYESEQFSGLVIGLNFGDVGGFSVLWHGIGASFVQHYNILQHTLAPVTPAPLTYAPETNKPTAAITPIVDSANTSVPGSNTTESPSPLSQPSSSSSFPKWAYGIIAFLLIDLIVVAIYIYRKRTASSRGDVPYVATTTFGSSVDYEMDRPYSPPHID